MADKKITALPAAATPLAGTEVLPIVQGGTTDQVSVANLTVGRDVAVKKLNPTDNVVMAAGKGIDFSANGGDVLTQYDEGTYTPVATGVTVVSGTPVWSGTYTRIGRNVTVHWQLTGGASVNLALSSHITLPFAALAGTNPWGSYGNVASNTFVGGIVAYGADLYFGTATAGISSCSGTITYQI